MNPPMEKLGYERRMPALVIASSLFWDEKFLDERGRSKTVDRGSAHGFWWNELAWFRGRVRRLVETVLFDLRRAVTPDCWQCQKD